MKKIILITLGLSIFIYADFMDSVADVVKSTLSSDSSEEESLIDESEVTMIKTVRTVETVGTKVDKPIKNVDKNTKDTVGVRVYKHKSVEEDSILDMDLDFDSVITGVKKSMGIKEEKRKKKSFLGDTLTAAKEVTGLKKVKHDDSYFDGGIMGDMADMIELEKGESWLLPSVFGLNKKKHTKVFGSTVLGDSVFGDVKKTGSTFYKGFKSSGQTAEFMSGMMYYNSKMYNSMFGMFDGSPLNIFEDEDEASIFDLFDTGNSMLDMIE